MGAHGAPEGHMIMKLHLAAASVAAAGRAFSAMRIGAGAIGGSTTSMNRIGERAWYSSGFDTASAPCHDTCRRMR